MSNSNHIGLMDKDTLLEIFDYLNERLKENQLHLEITIYGESIMTMVYDNRPAIKDIDCVFGELIQNYYLQINNIEVPNWLRHEKLEFDKPYYHSKRITDFEKFRLQYTSPAPFRIRNVYFDVKGLERV